MLILFDIDLTLVRSSGLGVASMQRALEAIHGRAISFDGIAIGGRLDPLIWNDAAVLNGFEATDAAHAEFRARYTAVFNEAIAGGIAVEALPGAIELVEAASRIEGTTIGLLTGNYMETGRAKVQAAGIDPDQFPICAWGSDGAMRRDLPPVAMAAYGRLTGTPVDSRAVTILGDTIDDVDCARFNGCRSLAVATGHCSFAELEAAGADRVVDDLRDTAGIIEWMTDGGGLDHEPGPGGIS